VAIRGWAAYLRGMKTRHEPLYARVEALPLPRAERELAKAYLADAAAFADFLYAALAALSRFSPARSAQAPRSARLRAQA
jgi:hypothetical protein